MCFKISNFTYLTILFKLSKHVNLWVFWVSKSKNLNRRNPLNNSIDNIFQTLKFWIIFKI